MYSACDIEGHLGTDGRHYLLDFSRSFPPESPYKVRLLGPDEMGWDGMGEDGVGWDRMR